LQEVISAQAEPLEKPSSLFIDRDFMRVWFAGGMVGVMRWMDVLVVGYYTVQITGSALITAQMLFLRMLPMFLLVPSVGRGQNVSIVGFCWLA